MRPPPKERPQILSIKLRGRGQSLEGNLCALCRQLELEARCLHMCQLERVSMRCLGNLLWMCLHMLCLGQLHSRFRLRGKRRSISQTLELLLLLCVLPKKLQRRQQVRVLLCE